MADRYQKRPSELLGLGLEKDDAFVAYCLDEAVHTYVTFVENKIHEATKNLKNPDDMRRVAETQMRILGLLDSGRGEGSTPVRFGPEEAAKLSENPPVPAAGTFQDPAAVFARMRKEIDV